MLHVGWRKEVDACRALKIARLDQVPVGRLDGSARAEQLRRIWVVGACNGWYVGPLASSRDPWREGPEYPVDDHQVESVGVRGEPGCQGLRIRREGRRSMCGTAEDPYVDAGPIDPVGRIARFCPASIDRSSPTKTIGVHCVAEVDKPLTQPDEHGCGPIELGEVSEEMADAHLPHSASGSAQL
jgi:hypothetical protein